MLKARIINTTEEFEKLRERWDSLISEAGSDNIFITFDWQFSYWKYFGKKDSLFIVVVFDDEKVIAIFPFMKIRRFGFRELRFISYPISDYEDIVITKDMNKRDEALRLAMNTLSSAKEWDMLRLKGIRQDSLVYESIQRSFNSGAPLRSFLQQHCDGAPQIDLVCGWDSYYSGLRKSFVSDIRAFRKRAGQNIEYIPGDAISDGDLPQILEKFMQMYTQRRRESGDNSFFDNERMRSFFYSALQLFFRRKWLEVSQYKINGELAAMEIGISSNGRFFRYLAAFDSQFKKCSVARLLLFEIIKRCFERGLKTFDFMLGEEPYKRFWNPVPQRIFFWTMHKKTISGYSAYLLFNRCNLLYKKITGKKW